MITAAPPVQTWCPICSQPAESDGLCLACLMQCAEANEVIAFSDDGDQEPAPRIGSYELVEQIGRGGMGVIYKARQIHTGRLVAMKILQSHIAHQPELLARFRREAEAVARLDHPHVLPVYEVNEEADGVPFFTMKLATGSLAERRPALAGRPREIAALIAKVARAVQHAHERGVLHRDLKPGNILFDAQGEPMVSDFGLAAWLHQESDLTRTIMVFGTPGYLPPEYVNGRPEVLQAASDVYSLGVILFELLAGRLPVPAEASLSAIRAAATRPAPRLRSIDRRADRDLEVICERCLAVEPASRFRRAGVLADDLERWLRGEPIVARPTPIVVRAWKFARRHAAMVIAAALCVVLAAGGATLNHFRQKTAQKLNEATAYDRSACLLPVEDLDALSTASPLALEATGFCSATVRAVPGLTWRDAAAAPDPLPHDRDLIHFSKTLGARFLLSATVRGRDGHKRLVIHAIDAARDTAAPPLVLETSTLDGAFDAAALVALVRKFFQPSAPPPVGADPGEMRPDETDAEKYTRAGDQLLKRGTPTDVDLALEAYRKAVQLAPEDPAALAGLAAAMAHRGIFGEAETWFAKALPLAERAVRAAPFQAVPARVLSRVHAMRGDARTALKYGLVAFELDGSDPRAASAVATAHEVEGAYDRALLWIERASRRDSTPGAYAFHRGDYLAAIGEFGLAGQAYREYAEFHPERADAPMALAALDLLEGNAALALETIRALHLRFPSDPVVAQTHAAIEFRVGDPATAEKIYEGFVNDPFGGLTAYQGVRAGSALGCLALRRGEDRGRTLIEQALALDREQLEREPGDGLLLCEIGANLAMLERDAEAIESLRAAMQDSPSVIYSMRLDRRLETLRTHPDFAQIIETGEARLRAMRDRIKRATSTNP